MAVVKGLKEKIHSPLYDSITVRAGEQLGKTQNLNILRFFQDITLKNKLQTNMQAASLLPHWNTFEARAMRVVISDLKPVFLEKPTSDLAGVRIVGITGADQGAACTLKSLTLSNYVELRRRIEAFGVRVIMLSNEDVNALSTASNTVSSDPALGVGKFAALDRGQIEKLGDALAACGVAMPPNEQILPKNGFDNLIGKLIYNSVTTFYVGEKVMIQMPTWFFPAGAGPCANGNVTTHGEASPEATFRFAEPIHIDAQQNFRVEIEVPDNEVMSSLQKLYGPFFIWVVIDGFMTRDVQ